MEAASNAPREETDYTTLYKTFLTRETPLPLICYDSRSGDVPRCRLPFPPERSGFSWTSRLERAREEIPKAVFRPTRPKIYKRNSFNANYELNEPGNNVTVLALEIPTKRGRGRPKKDSTVLVDAAAVNRSSFFVKRSYKNSGGESDSIGIHTIENYTLHGHGGADVDAHEIGIIRPERHYLRTCPHISRCEYDLDDQDVEWLKLVKEQFPEMQLLNEDVMERVIEELEQGWNVLTQPLRKLQQRKEAALYPDEVPCEICGDSDTSNCNVIVLCDDCDLAVHQECYGVPHIPEGPWLCRPCSEKKLTSYGSRSGFTAKCMLCPWPGGAMRKTADHRWVHSLCAHLVPETAITFTASDPHDLVDTCTLQSDRAKLRCVLCRGDPKIDLGYPIQCGSKACHVAFHPMCARSVGWTVQYSTRKAYCGKHTPESAEVDILTESEDTAPADTKLRLNLNTSTSNGSLSPTKSKYPSVQIGDNCPLHVARSGQKLRIPTFAPKVLILHISKNLELNERESLRFMIVQKIAKYWAMKRENRRGTPLLKSLQLEPGWSQTAEMARDAFEREWNDKMNLIRSLRALKSKVDLARRREACKLSSFESSVEIFEILSSPFTMILTKLIHKLQNDVDRPGYFAHPVPCDLFPDYPLMIQYPMDFSTILKNLKADLNRGCFDEMNYPTLAHFYADMKLIWENSRAYNTRTSVFYQAADRLENYAKALLCQIQSKFNEFEIGGPFDILNFRSDAVNLEKAEFVVEKEVEPTPARFPKTLLTPIGGLSVSDSQSKVQSVSVSSVNSARLKRRGRPPKRRENEIVLGGSIDSIASSEDGKLVENVSGNVKIKVEKMGRNGKIGRKRGRPPKLNKQEQLDGVDDVEVFEAGAVVDQRNEMSDLFWVPLRNGNWCSGERFTSTDPAKRAKRTNSADAVTVRLFDAFRSVLTVERQEDLKPLTDDFEKDLEGLKFEGVVSRKHLAAAHRAALHTLTK